MNPKALHVFKVWFKEFSTKGFMSKQQCANFIHSCTQDNCKPTDNRIVKIFNTYDDDQDGKITKTAFIKFYSEAAKNTPLVVWSNISNKQISNDLIIYSE